MSQDGHSQPAGPQADVGPRVDLEEGEKVGTAVRGIGSLFREEREKRGLTYSQVSEITKLRPYILEALENEDWDSLPSPGFVRGFVHSYARALGLYEDEVVGLYQETAPSVDTVLRPPAVPIGIRKKILPLILGVVMLLAMASAYYISNEYTSWDRVGVSDETNGPMEDRAGKKQDTQEVLDKTEPVVQIQEKATPVTPERPPAVAGEHVSPNESEMVADAGSGEGEETGLVLRAAVKERTWVRIFVDDQDPKEYIFQPGSEPEWTANEGFELVIGNAGGIELELNGQRVEDLGRSGQVVRLRLPKQSE